MQVTRGRQDMGVRPVRGAIAALLAISMATSAAAEQLPGEYDPVIAHLDTLKAGTITSSLAYVDEQVAIFSVGSGREPRQIASGRRSMVPLYIMSFGTEPGSITAYECVDRTGSVYCTFVLKAGGQPAPFALQFWVDGREISKIAKWYDIQSANGASPQR